MNKQDQFIQLKEQSKEGVKAFILLLGFIFVSIVAVSLIICYSDQIDAAMEVFTNWIN